MGTDDLLKRRRQEREDRIAKNQQQRLQTWLLVCEGEKTEPNYFESLIEYANSKSEKKIRYQIVGTGRNTESLVSLVDRFFN